MTERVYKDQDGVRRTSITDPDYPGRLIVRTEQVLDGVFQSVERDRDIMRNDGVNKLVARIPIMIYERAVHEEWDESDWRKWLNSAEARPFRIWDGDV